MSDEPLSPSADLFGPLTGLPTLPSRSAEAPIRPATLPSSTFELAQALHEAFGDRLRLGTSSWHFPGWAGHVWAAACPQPRLSQQGLAAYAAHPLLRTVSLDRAFYRIVPEDEYAALARQVAAAPGFRFVVKAPALLTDAQQRDAASGRATAINPHFLDPALALDTVLRPLQQGLGDTMGVLVLQLSPLPPPWRDDMKALLTRLDRLLDRLAPALQTDARVAVEVRDADLLTPTLAACLKAHGARYALGVHSRLPEVNDQLPLLRATWPGDFICRWNLQRGQQYAQARDAWAPFDRLRSEDPATRQALARVAVGTLRAGHRVWITINNKAEGCAPASVVALARALARQAGLGNFGNEAASTHAGTA